MKRIYRMQTFYGHNTHYTTKKKAIEAAKLYLAGQGVEKIVVSDGNYYITVSGCNKENSIISCQVEVFNVY